MKCYFIRHGVTKGNMEHRYVGRTDEGLESGAQKKLEKLKKNLPPMDHIFVSPYLRCLQSANILFGSAAEGETERESDRTFVQQGKAAETEWGINLGSQNRAEDWIGFQKTERVADFREMDFGEFEYKNYRELNTNPVYQSFIDSGGALAFPGGEEPEAFKARCCRAFAQCMERVLKNQWENSSFVVHGGTIMAILEAYGVPQKGYYEYQTENGSGFCAAVAVENSMGRKQFHLTIKDRL